jgi:hypothetical protein
LGLVKVEYFRLGDYLSEANAKDDPALGDEIKCLPIEKQLKLFKLVFNEMRENLCIDTRYLSPDEQERTKSCRDLKEPWNFPADEKLSSYGHFFFESPETRKDRQNEIISGGPRSRIVRLINREKFWQGTKFENAGWKGFEYSGIVKSILAWAEKYRYVKQVPGVKSWRLSSSALLWRLCSEDTEQERTARHNEFFRKLYFETAKTLTASNHHLFDYESHEHTAQVDQEIRQKLEQRFRFDQKAKEEGLRRLPVLYCSPTMELGIDISSLDTVYMRNVPPTPANYAQRSGRAGRSGQAALAVTYCTALSPHDQWFFKHKEDMVYGKVKTPLFDLSNKDLINSHLHSVWLQPMGVELPPGIKDVLNLKAGGMPIIKDYAEKLQNQTLLAEAVKQAKSICDGLRNAAGSSLEWLTGDYVDMIFNNIFTDFNKAFDRWRELYKATNEQMESSHRISMSPGTSQEERASALRRYYDASRQRDVLLSEAR